MRTIVFLMTAFICAAFCAPAHAKSPTGLTVKYIKKRLSDMELGSRAGVELFYERRSHMPAWSNASGLLPAAEGFADTLRRAPEDGLDPEFYRLKSIEKIVKRASKTPKSAVLARADVLLTDAFITYCSDLTEGRISPESGVRKSSITTDCALILQDALDSCGDGYCTFEGLIKTLRPPHEGYLWLAEALSGYRGLEGWPMIADGPNLKEGDSGERVDALCRRLKAAGDLKGNARCVSFDGVVAAGVKNFQRRHGLSPDGVVGPETLNALNVPLYYRIRQMEINMERWRWFPRKLGRRHILVNTADFSLDVVEDGKTVLHMLVVVGKPYWHTPVFSARMTHLVFNPEWRVPDNIASDEILTALIKDPDYLSMNDFKVYSGEREVDPSGIDWPAVNPENPGFRFVQSPGPGNPLGRIKFMFPNKYAVYMHDTPQRELFAKKVRMFSHGCIRIEKPVELASYLLGWSRKDVRFAIDDNLQMAVDLPEAVDAHLFYRTAWVDDKGRINFRDDVYERDWLIDFSLKESMPPAILKKPPADTTGSPPLQTSP